MSWLNLNESFNSLKGQITNFASEVLSEDPAQEEEENAPKPVSRITELEEKCRQQELEIASLQKLNEELQASLQSERYARRNGVRDEDQGWYWDPRPSSSHTKEDHPRNLEDQYQVQIRALQDELSSLKERDTIDARPEMEEELNRLREENKHLTTNLEELDSQHQLAMDRLLGLKKELQKNFEILKQEHEELKSNNDEYSEETKLLMKKVADRDKEIEEMKTLKSDYETLHHKYQSLERIHGLLRENAEKFQEENQELHEEVFKLQEMVSKLEHDLDTVAKSKSDTVPREQYLALEKEFNDLMDRKNSNPIHLDDTNIDDNAKSLIENLKRDITELNYKLADKEMGTSEDTNIRVKQILQLFNKYINFEIPLDYVGDIPSVGDDLLLHKLESVFKTANQFKKDIDVLEHQLSEKNHNINHMQTQIDDLTTENDFLTTDLQHLETDLNEMKRNNDFLLSELTALKNVSKLEPIIETQEENLAKLETELADSNKLNKTFETEIMKIQAELAEVQNEKKALQESLTELKSKYVSIFNEVDICKNKTDEMEEMETTLTKQHDEKYNKTLKEIDELKKKLLEASSKNEQLQIDVQIVENDKVLLTKEINELKNALVDKTAAYKELESINVVLDTKRQEFESQLNELIKNKAEIEFEKVRLEDKVTLLENRIPPNNSTEEMKQIATQKAQISENIEKMSKENATLKEACKFFKAKVAYLEDKDRNQNSDKSNVNKITVVTKNSTNIQTVDELEMIKAQQGEGDVNKALLVLNDENKKLKQELASTDSKIIHLEQEFERLMTDIEEKDSTIDELNTAVHDNKVIIFNLNRTVTDLEQSIVVKEDELERLRLRAESLSNQLVNSRERFNQSQEELFIVRNNAEDIGHELNAMRGQMALQNTQINALGDVLKEAEKSRDQYIQNSESKDKIIHELQQKIHDFSNESNETNRHSSTLFANLSRERDTIFKQLEDSKNYINEKDKELKLCNEKIKDLEKLSNDYKEVIEKSNNEKSELINFINLKHNESLQYHNEIQRLNQVLLDKTNDFKQFVEEKDKLIQSQNTTCVSCDNLRVTLKEKDEIIKTLNQNVNDCEKMKTELAKSGEIIRNLTEKCDNLDKNLNIQLEAVKKLTTENAQLSEQEQNSARELERLRRHLVETEESYTQELMTSEQKLTECQARLHQVEERAKQTSTVYTSNSIRANQEVETLRNQIKLLEKQREEVQVKLSEAEDARSRSEAALTNLQIVLEQFQLDKEREVASATEKIKNKMEDIKRENQDYIREISRLNAKLEEALNGLQAASRLGDQLETKTAQIHDLKEQVKALQSSVTAAEERYYSAISNQQDKVDKNLVKNLLINYVLTAAAANKTQVLRILSTVLDFNQQECSRLGLAKTQQTDSLALEFVKFLHDESTPRNKEGNKAESSRKSSVASVTSGPPPTSQVDPTHKRNPSTGSNNLLFSNIEAIETSSQISHNSRTSLDTGVNQTRNNEGAILKYVLRDM